MRKSMSQRLALDQTSAIQVRVFGQIHSSVAEKKNQSSYIGKAPPIGLRGILSLREQANALIDRVLGGWSATLPERGLWTAKLQGDRSQVVHFFGDFGVR